MTIAGLVLLILAFATAAAFVLTKKKPADDARGDNGPWWF